MNKGRGNTAIRQSIVALLAITLIVNVFPNHVHARWIIDPIRCQQGKSCPCKPPAVTLMPKFWVCK